MNINNEEIKKIFIATETARILGDYFVKYKRDRGDLNLRHLKVWLESKKHNPIVKQDFIDTFKGLEKLNLGRIIMGKHGGYNAFRLQCNLKELKQAICEALVVEDHEAEKDPNHSVTLYTSPAGGIKAARGLILLVSTRKDDLAKLELPKTIGSKQSEELIKLIAQFLS